MKINRIRIISLVLVAALGREAGYAQGFINLDFESAQGITGNQPNIFPVASAIPGWKVYLGTNQQSQIYYNNLSLGATRVNLVGSSDPFGASCIEGSYGVLLQGGETDTDASIRQTGTIPIGTQSIQFKANIQGPAYLLLGGQNISYTALGVGPNYTLYAGNIPVGFAGQAEQLEFSVPQGPGGNNAWNLDSIVFSPNAVPEPETFTLLGLGGLLSLSVFKRQR